MSRTDVIHTVKQIKCDLAKHEWAWQKRQIEKITAVRGLSISDLAISSHVALLLNFFSQFFFYSQLVYNSSRTYLSLPPQKNTPDFNFLVNVNNLTCWYTLLLNDASVHNDNHHFRTLYILVTFYMAYRYWFLAYRYFYTYFYADFFLTFVEAFFAVYNGDSLTGKTRGSVQLTVVLVELPIRSTYRFVVWLAVLQTLALSMTACMVHYTVLPQTTVLMVTGIWEAVMTKQACRDKK